MAAGRRSGLFRGPRRRPHRNRLGRAHAPRAPLSVWRQPMKIHLVTTGGTIEKIYSEQTGQVENLTAKIDRYLHQLRLPDALIEVTPLMNKDSLEMTEEDRELVLSV